MNILKEKKGKLDEKIVDKNANDEKDDDEKQLMMKTNEKKYNVLNEMMKTAKLITKKKVGTPERLLSMKNKPNRKKMKNTVMKKDNKKSELEIMFEKMEKKKLEKRNNEYDEKEAMMKNEHDEKKIQDDEKRLPKPKNEFESLVKERLKRIEKDEKEAYDKKEMMKRMTNDEKKEQIDENKRKIDEKIEIEIVDAKENIVKKDLRNGEKELKEIDKKKKKMMKKSTNGRIYDEIGDPAGQNGQKTDKKRTFFETWRLKNQFGMSGSPTTKPQDAGKEDKFSMGICFGKEHLIHPNIPIAGVRNVSTVNAYRNSPGKRKFDDMECHQSTNSVQELIGNFEVGTKTKRKKVGRSSCSSENQPHSVLDFGRERKK